MEEGVLGRRRGDRYRDRDRDRDRDRELRALARLDGRGGKEDGEGLVESMLLSAERSREEEG
eukprot:689707-Hanusia_phi.AAC.5